MKKSFLAAVFMIQAVPVMAVDYQLKGFLKTSLVHTNKSLLSFGYDSLQAPTEVANLDSSTTTSSAFKKEQKTSFQVAQSRFGLHLQQDHIKGIIELDFTDFTGNAFGKSDPRLRIAELTYTPSEGPWSLRAGQGWSTFSTFGVHTFNIVGNGFRAGASGFLSQFAEARYETPHLFLAASLAQKGRNITGYALPSGGDNSLKQNETNRGLPLATLKFEQHFDSFKWGAAYSYAKFDLKETSLADSRRSDSALSQGAKIFTQLHPFADLEIRAEGYVGTNLNDLYYLTLADRTYKNTYSRNTSEWGGFTSLKLKLNEKNQIHASYGHAAILSSIHDLNSGKIIKNQSLKMGYAYSPTPGLQLFAEANPMRSTYLLAGQRKAFSALWGEAGVLYTF
jgi:hypothetical protein